MPCSILLLVMVFTLHPVTSITMNTYMKLTIPAEDFTSIRTTAEPAELLSCSLQCEKLQHCTAFTPLPVCILGTVQHYAGGAGGAGTKEVWVDRQVVQEYTATTTTTTSTTSTTTGRHITWSNSSSVRPWLERFCFVFI